MKREESLQAKKLATSEKNLEAERAASAEAGALTAVLQRNITYGILVMAY